MSRKQQPSTKQRVATRQAAKADPRLMGLGIPLVLLMPAILCQGAPPLLQSPGTLVARQLTQLKNVLSDVESKIRRALSESTEAGDGVKAAAIDVDTTLQSLELMLARLDGSAQKKSVSAAVAGNDTTICIGSGEPAALFMSLSAAHFPYDIGSVGILIVGNQGTQQFAFASGVSVASVVAAVNTFARETGVQASPAPGVQTPYLVRLQSTQSGQDQYVAALVTSKPLPMLFPESLDSPGLPSLIDFGDPTTVPWSATPQ